MNTLEIYRRLPRTNCGRCQQDSCMALAVCISTGRCRAKDCPELSEEALKELAALVAKEKSGDWREELVAKLQDELKTVDIKERAAMLGIDADKGGHFHINYLGEKYSSESEEWNSSLNHWDRILILRYILNGGGKTPAGDWTAFRDLKDGSVKASAFRKECEEPLARLYENCGQGLIAALENIGAERAEGQPAPEAWTLRPLPEIPFLILLWPGEPGIQPDCRILPDKTAVGYLDVESLIFLGERLVERLEKLCEG